MAHKNIEALINSKGQNPWEYSFELEAEGMTEDENKAFEEFKGKGAIERYLIYRSTDCDRVMSVYIEGRELAKDNIKKYGIIPDCDGSDGYCKLAIDLYKKLWDWGDASPGKKFLKINNIMFGRTEFGGDTMNSAQTAMDILLESVANPKSEYYNYKQGGFSANFYMHLYAKFGESFVRKLEENTTLKIFLGSYHTLGNFVLVPAGFNKKRGSKSTYDFWDSSLVWLKRYGYGNFKAEYFKNYINYFFLWDYVDKVDKEGKYKIKPLFESHDKIEDGETLEESKANWTNITEEEAGSFMENATAIIRRRGIFMTAMLRLKAHIGDDEYNNLRREVFEADKPYSGYEDVIKQILIHLNNKLPEDVEKTLTEEWNLEKIKEELQAANGR